MKIASVSSSTPGETDRLLCALADALLARGHNLAGIVKDQSHETTYANGCDMRVRVLPEGPLIKITQDLGTGSDACRLDPGAIAEAVVQVESSDLAATELFVLNKFGPEEAAGRGFCTVIGKAIEAGVPVLVGVGKATQGTFDDFAGGMATSLADDENAIRQWCDATLAPD